MLDERHRSGKRLRVVQVIYGFGIEGGGAGRLGMELARRLDRRCFDPVVCGLWDCGSHLEKEIVAKLHQEDLAAFTAAAWDSSRPYASFTAALRGLRMFLRAEPADILHSHSEFGDIAILPFSSAATHLVRTVHNGYRVEWRKRPLRRYLFTNLLIPLIFHKEVAVNHGIAAAMNRRPAARLLGKQAVLIPNGIDLERFRLDQGQPGPLKAEFNFPEGAFVIGSAGRLSEGKGLDIFLRAAARLVEMGEPVYFLIIGDGELRPELQSLTHDLGIQSRVIFTGPRADIDRLYSCMDLFASTSYWEGISTVILESMAAGVPVVATAIPGNQTIMEDGVHGWLVPPGDVDSLAMALLSAMKDPVERKARAQRALARVQDFNIEGIVRRYEALYEEMMKAIVRSD
ncbi:MAG: glycosyltransferase [Chloroflexi bacterium]|nr:glycosyltransferase [Chloroflexota bacterium]